MSGGVGGYIGVGVGVGVYVYIYIHYTTLHYIPPPGRNHESSALGNGRGWSSAIGLKPRPIYL